jgi:nitroreductase
MKNGMKMTGDQDDAHRTVSAPQGTSVMEVITRRVSCRSYKTDPIPQEHVERILEAARLAPSASNRQPWRFAVARDQDTRYRIVEEGFLSGIKMAWALDAPVHVVIGMELSFVTHRLGAFISGVSYPWIDIGIAGEHLVLAATELGLGTCWIGWIRPHTLGRIVGWPAAVKPVAVIAVGYPRVPGETKPAASRRKTLDEIVRWM